MGDKMWPRMQSWINDSPLEMQTKRTCGDEALCRLAQKEHWATCTQCGEVAPFPLTSTVDLLICIVRRTSTTTGTYWQDGMRIVLEIDIVMSSSLFMLITYYSVLSDTNECDWHSIRCISPILIRISVTDMIISVTSLWYHFIPFFGDHYDIIFYSYQWCHISLSCTIYLQSSVITYHSDLILCYYCTICSLPFIMGSFLGLFRPLLIVSSTHTNNTLDVYKLGPYDPKY